MKKISSLILLLIILTVSTGCVSKYYNPGITVYSPDITDLSPTNVGQFDLYAPVFEIQNPTNWTFSNVEVQINIIPSTAYCHPVSKTIEIPVFSPAEKRTEPVSIAEFSNLDCQYSYTYSVVAER